MKLIVISSPDFFRGEADIINSLFENGLEILHLRKPYCSEEHYLHLIKKIDSKYYKRITLHEHLHLAKKLSLGGVHLNRRNPEVPSNFHGRTSCSCHNVAEMQEMKKHHDYVFISPVFNSISKKNYKSAFSYKDLISLSLDCCIDQSVIALGGIEEGKLGIINSLNFGGAAVLGYLWQDKNPVERFKQLQQKALDLPSVGKVQVPKVLTIAGSDCSGGAGLQADIKTICSIGAYAASAITAITAQNTMGVRAAYPLSPQILKEQIEAVFDDIKPQAVKIGMVGNADIIKTIAAGIKKYEPAAVVFDPVMVATSGHSLLTDNCAAESLLELMPLCTLITPNTKEAEALLGVSINSLKDAREACVKLAEKVKTSVLVKGGHLDDKNSTDLLCIYKDGSTQTESFTAPRIDTKNLHGTGCTLSSAIATYLAIGYDLTSAVAMAKDYIEGAIEHAINLNIGKGNGPLWHNY